MTAAAWTQSNALQYNKAKFKPHDRQRVRVVKGTWNAAADGTLDAGNGDYLDIITVPAAAIILGVSLDVTTAETADGTCDIGVAGADITNDLDLYYDAAPLDSAYSVPPTGVGGIVFTGGNEATIRVTATTDTNDVDLDGVVMDVYCVYMELDAQVAKN